MPERRSDERFLALVLILAALAWSTGCGVTTQSGQPAGESGVGLSGQTAAGASSSTVSPSSSQGAQTATPTPTSGDSSTSVLPAPGATTIPPVVSSPTAPSSTGSPTPGAAADNVVIVSIDGMRPDALAQATAPNLKALISSGCSTMEGKTTNPSLTLPSHTSMLTGVGPARHGMTENSWSSGEAVVSVKTVFEVAHSAGMSTGFVVSKDKLRFLDKPGTIDTVEVVSQNASMVADKAVSTIQQKRPRLLFVHFTELDSVGHSQGWMSAAQIESVTQVDRAVGVILGGLDTAGIRARTAVIVNADHGGQGTGHGSTDAQDMTIPWIAAGSGIRKGQKVSRSVTIYDTAATALFLLGTQPPDDWDGSPISEIVGQSAADMQLLSSLSN